MPSRNNRNAARRNNNARIYASPAQSESVEVDSTFLSPPENVQQLVDDPPGHCEQIYDFGDDVERDGVGGLIQFDAEEDTQPVSHAKEESSAPSPLSLEPTSPLPGARQAPSRVAPESGGRSDVGHTRAPVMAREPTMLEAFSRTMRNYVPSSIPVPSAAPSPPRVSRPVSFGSFMSSSPAFSPTSAPSEKRRGSATGPRDPHLVSTAGRGQSDSPRYDPVILDSGDEDQELGRTVTYPGLKDEEDIVWAGWDTLQVDPFEKSRRVLLLGYRTGLQIWDCTSLASVTEILNIRDPAVGRVVHAGVLPTPPKTDDDAFATARPLVGIIHLNGDDSDYLVYSLRTHSVFKQLSLPGAISFSATSKLVVVATTAPPALHVLTSSLATLLTIPSSSLTPLVPHSYSPPPPDARTVLPQDIEISDNQYLSLSSRPRPIFALSGRLLAFASTPPSPEALPSVSSPEPQSVPSSDRASLPFGISQSDFGNAAVKVGGSVLSGMKSLGGLAYAAARSRLAGPQDRLDEENSLEADAPTAVAGLTNIFFSKSAPAATGGHHRSSSVSSVATAALERASGVRNVLSGSVFNVKSTSDTSLSSKGQYVTVLDVAPLLVSRPSQLVSRFLALKEQPVYTIGFSSDGTSLVVTPKDGQVAKVFALKPGLRSLRHSYRAQLGEDNMVATGGPPASDVRPVADGAPWHMYDLRRGRTSAVIESVDCARDGRWIALGSRKRTLHVFAVNPYGGKPDLRSHMEGKVRDHPELQPLSTAVTPITRFRFRARRSRLPVPLAFTFIQSRDFCVPTNLLPAPLSYPSSPQSLSVQSSPAGALKPLSPVPTLHRPANFQDLLVLDPNDGTLSLRRLTVEEHYDQGLAVPGSIPIVGGVSVSLPVGSPPNRMGTSPSNRSDHSSPRSSGLTQVMEKSELGAKDTIVATWNLRRSRGWQEVKHTLAATHARPVSVSARKDWLAHAELSTFSRSKNVVPRVIYLSHQIAFHAFGEDYHALIRRYQFDVPVSKIEVRREVQASAYSTGLGGETFVQGAHVAVDIRAPASSFDEPIASAISADFDYHYPSPPVIPMFPNGNPGARSSAMKAIPIRSVTSGISDGMNESLGRIRRELGKVRSPKAKRRSPRMDAALSSPVPLEFDEEDEDFLLPARQREDHESISRSGSGASASISTPSTHAQLLDNEDVEVWDADGGWTSEDRQAVDDAERFDDLVVGFMDEDQVSPEPHIVASSPSGKGKRKSKRRA